MAAIVGRFTAARLTAGQRGTSLHPRLASCLPFLRQSEEESEGGCDKAYPPGPAPLCPPGDARQRPCSWAASGPSASTRWGSSSCLLPAAAASQSYLSSSRGFASFPWLGGRADPPSEALGAVTEPEALTSAAVAAADPSLNPLEFASAVADSMQQAEAAARLCVVDSSWWVTGQFIQAMCYTTDTLGIPWWASIAAVTFGVRLALFPLVVWMEGAKVKMQKIQPEIDRLKEKYPGLYQGDKAAQEGFSRETHAVFAKHNMSPTTGMAMFPVGLSQAFLFGFFFFALHNMCAAKIPSLMTGGTAWFSDLTAPDPLFILPIGSTALMLATVELGAADMGSAANSATAKNFMRFLSITFLAMGTYWPAGLFVYFTSTNVFTLGQTAVMRSTAFRQAVGLPKPQPPSPTAGAKHESFTEMYKRLARKAEEIKAGPQDAATPTQLTGVKTFAVKRKRRGRGRMS